MRRNTRDYTNVITKANDLLQAYQNGRQLFFDIRSKYHSRNYFFISIGFVDPLFPYLAKYITKNCVQEDHRRNLFSQPDGFVFSFRPSDSVVVNIEGREIYVYVTKEDAPNKETKYPSWNDLMSPSYLEFKCKSKEEFQIIHNWLERMREEFYRKDTRPKLYTATGWDDWSAWGPIPDRSLDSIYLREGQVDKIVRDLTTFYASEAVYHQAGIPYHRGYMLYGPPGTGKTSFIMALANHFHKHVCFITPASIKTEKAINELFGDVPENAILVIEDIDTSFAVQDRQLNDATETERTSFSAMLNALDGFTTPNGLVLFMTTNDKDILDPAVLRPGRVDVLEEIGYMEPIQLNSMVSKFVGRTVDFGVGPELVGMKIAPAEISEMFKGYLSSDVRDGIVDDVARLVDARRSKLTIGN